MAKISGKYILGTGVVVEYAINDGVAVMTCNYAKQLQGIYFKAKAAGKKVEWNYRKNAMIEKFDCTAEEFKKKLDIDFSTAKDKQVEAIKWAKENVKK